MSITFMIGKMGTESDETGREQKVIRWVDEFEHLQVNMSNSNAHFVAGDWIGDEYCGEWHREQLQKIRSELEGKIKNMVDAAIGSDGDEIGTYLFRRYKQLKNMVEIAESRDLLVYWC